PGDIDGCEAEAGQDADRREVEELAVAEAEGSPAQRASPHQTRATMTAISAAITRSASNRLPSPACGGSGAAGSACVSIAPAGMTIVSDGLGASAAGGGRTQCSGCRVFSSSCGRVVLSRV